MEPELLSSHLGARLREFRLSRKAFLTIGCLTLGSALIGGIFFYGIFFGEEDRWADIVGMGIGGTLLSLPAIAGIYVLFTRRGSTVWLHEKGFAYRQGKTLFAARWEEIVSIIESSALRVTKVDGQWADIGTNIEGVDEFSDIIKDETLRHLLPSAQSRLNSGGEVVFSQLKMAAGTPLAETLNRTILKGEGLRMGPHGIATEAGNLSFSEIEDYGIEAGQGRQGPWFVLQGSESEIRIPAATLANLHLLLALLEEKAPLDSP